METQTHSADLQATLMSILASIHKVQEDANKPNKTLHNENKKKFAAVHDQSKQNKSLLEATERRYQIKYNLYALMLSLH